MSAAIIDNRGILSFKNTQLSPCKHPTIMNTSKIGTALLNYPLIIQILQTLANEDKLEIPHCPL